MTDERAKKYAYKILGRPQYAGELEEFVRHALQAIEDRAAILALYAEREGDPQERAEERLRVHFAVERHMKGEP
jgi:hypothetical protein